MPQDDGLINYTSGQPNPTPFVPGSEYVAKAPKGQGKTNRFFKASTTKSTWKVEREQT